MNCDEGCTEDDPFDPGCRKEDIGGRVGGIRESDASIDW